MIESRGVFVHRILLKKQTNRFSKESHDIPADKKKVEVNKHKTQALHELFKIVADLERILGVHEYTRFGANIYFMCRIMIIEDKGVLKYDHS